MLTEQRLETILAGIPPLTIGVVGDLFLDRYFDLDDDLTEPSLETGLDAYQVVGVRSSPGAAGTVINNLAALGVHRILPVAVIGDDGEGYELQQALKALEAVDAAHIFSLDPTLFRTPTYLKPMLGCEGEPARELNRLDIKNRRPLPEAAEKRILEGLLDVWSEIDALVVLDQVSEADCGVITTKVRSALADLGITDPGKPVLADSRERIGDFRSVWLKPNLRECIRAVQAEQGPQGKVGDEAWFVAELARRAGRPVFCTWGERGILLANAASGVAALIPAYPVAGRIDPVGAGDSTSAGIVCALAAGATLEEAAAFGNLVASITIQQIGTTGTATPAQVRQRWKVVERQ